MIDIRLVREEQKAVAEALKKRNSPKETFDLLLEISKKDEEWRKIKKEEETLRAERNKLSMEISEAKKAKKPDKEIAPKIKRSGEIAGRIKEISEETAALEEKIKEIAAQLPNIPHESVPVGKTSDDNIEVRKWGKPKKTSKDVLDHHTWGEKTGLIDFERGVKLAGHRFAILRGKVAKLERALINFMLSLQTSHGYEEVLPPHMVNTKTMYGCGHLPKFEAELYKCKEDDLWLIPTAEVPVTSIYSGEVIEEEKLPVKFCAYTPCYRREAGAYGKDIKGYLRQHQFNKVELVKLAHPNNSFEELETMLRDAESVLQALELPYRVIQLCTGDMGFASAKTYDIEVWLPSQDTYREISSVSNCTDFQARRANIKYRDKSGKPAYVHTLNGSGLAIGRTLIAILENCQEKNEIKIPKVLQDFMGEESISF
jgi:seryl-tRNA synthetase